MAERTKSYHWAILAGFLTFAIVTLAVTNWHKSSNSQTSNATLQVVAGENFWGSLVSQIGGTHAHVISIVSDPNADPHEYESSTANAREFATANYVVLNGAGYDSWGNKLLSASTNSNRKVLTVADLVGKKEGDNPHFWYNPDYVNKVVDQMATDLSNLDPKDASYFHKNLTTLQSSLSVYQNRIVSIKQKYGGTKVAATEDIFVYLANASGLNLISPPAFIQAIAEGNDPPASSITQFEQQLQNKEVKVLVYNEQTSTPLTENVKKIAAEQGIPIVGITETIQPPNASFQDWINAELVSLNNALGSGQ